jgi:hypothetical protein
VKAIDASELAFPARLLHRGNLEHRKGYFTIEPLCTQIPESHGNSIFWLVRSSRGHGLFLRGQPGSSVAATRDAHGEIRSAGRGSPAAAAYLVERGLNDKPVAVAIVNMAAKAHLRIDQRADDYVLVPGNTSVPLEAEEELIAKGLSARGASSVRLSDLRTLPRISRQVRGLIESAVEPDLISPHFWCFIPGLTLSMWCFLAALVPEMQVLWDSGSSGGIVLPALLSVAFLLSTVRTLPAMIYKIRSLMPGGAPYRMRFFKGDATAPCLLLAATAALAVIGWATSPEFALLFGSFAVVNILGWMALRSPTAKGRVLLQQLSEFRMFLAAVDSGTA